MLLTLEFVLFEGLGVRFLQLLEKALSKNETFAIHFGMF